MSHHYVDREVSVTAHERAHPAIRKLARACLALARLDRTPPNTSSAASPHAKSQEVRHD